MNNTILNVSLCAKVFKTLRFYMHGHEFTDHYYDCINFTGTDLNDPNRNFLRIF